MVELFPFAAYWWLYLGFTGFVLLVLALDLGVFHRHAHEVSFREAAIWTVVWMILALGFNFLLYQYALWQLPQDPRLLAIPDFDPSDVAWRISMEFLASYIVEKSLSVDNVFVFVLIFSYFAIPAKYQHRVLFYGIIGALVFRAIFIALGSALLQYHWIMLIFGVSLIFTGAKIMFAPEKGLEPDKNLLIGLFRRFVPITSDLHGQRFFRSVERGTSCHAVICRGALFGNDGYHLRGRFCASDLRFDERVVHRVHVQYFRYSGLACVVLHAGRSGGQVPSAEVRACCGAHLCWTEDGVAQQPFWR